jgi:hypothetical protein
MPSTPTLHVISLDSVLPLSFTLTCLWILQLSFP